MNNTLTTTIEAASTHSLTPIHAASAPATAARASRLPFGLKLAYTAFMAVLVPVYWSKYGPTNFLYFCDVALFLTLAGLWRESRLLLSMAAVGILLPQFLWCADFVAEMAGLRLAGMTAYMFDAGRPVFLRGLSLFHGWLPFLLLYAVRRVGYDRRAWWSWTAVAWALCLVAYFLLPPAGDTVADALTPRNVNYVWGLDDRRPQSWLPAPLYLVVWMSALWVVVYLPTHLLLRRWGRGGSGTTTVASGAGAPAR